MLAPTIRWTDRLQSSSGEWSGNLCDFYFRVYNKIIMNVKTPFAIEGGDRNEDTPVHEALREALANCLINADYYGTHGVVIKKEPVIEERFAPDCTILSLEFVQKQAKKIGEENRRRKQAKKNKRQYYKNK